MALAIENTGTGVPLVFLHAFPLSKSMWKPQVDALSRNFRVITVDLPGFGESPVAKDTTRMEDAARAVIRTLDERGVTQPAVFTGLSMGGYVLLQILRVAPQRVRAAVLVSTRTAADTPEGKEKRLQNVALVEKDGVTALADRMLPALLGDSTRQERSGLVEQVRAEIRRQPATAVTAALRGMAERPESTPVLAGIACPAMIVAGAEDTVIKSDEMEAMSKKIPKGEFQLIEKAGHLLSLEAPERFNDVFLHFLKRRVL